MPTTYSPEAAAVLLKKLYYGRCCLQWLESCQHFIRTGNEIFFQRIQKIEVMRGSVNCTNCVHALKPRKSVL